MNNTVPSRWNRGIKYFNRKLVDHITVNINDGIVTFDAIAESEFFNDVYTTSISIDTINNKIHQHLANISLLICGKIFTIWPIFFFISRSTH